MDIHSSSVKIPRKVFKIALCTKNLIYYKSFYDVTSRINSFYNLSQFWKCQIWNYVGITDDVDNFKIIRNDKNFGAKLY